MSCMSSMTMPANSAPVLSENLLAEFERIGTVLHKPMNTVLFRQGDAADGVYLIRSGEASLTLCSAKGKVLSAREVGHGAVLGLPATMSGRAYSLTATLLQDSEIVHVPPERLRDLLRDNTEVCFEVVQVLGRELTFMRSLAAGMSA